MVSFLQDSLKNPCIHVLRLQNYDNNNYRNNKNDQNLCQIGDSLDDVADDSGLILRCVDPEIVTVVSKNLNAFIFRAKRSKTFSRSLWVFKVDEEDYFGERTIGVVSH